MQKPISDWQQLQCIRRIIGAVEPYWRAESAVEVADRTQGIDDIGDSLARRLERRLAFVVEPCRFEELPSGRPDEVVGIAITAVPKKPVCIAVVMQQSAALIVNEARRDQCARGSHWVSAVEQDDAGRTAIGSIARLVLRFARGAEVDDRRSLVVVGRRPCGHSR